METTQDKEVSLMVTELLGKEGFKRSYLDSNKVTPRPDSCINIVEDIIEAFSDNNNIKTCDSCRQLVADIISNHLGGGLSTEKLTEGTQYAEHKKII
jgi:hypothetical protein